MILLVHMLFGAAIGSSVHNVYLAIILALLGHYLLDLFPHIEYLNGVENSIKSIGHKNWRKNAADITKVLIDFCLGLLLIFLFSKNHPLIYICAIVAIIPDGLTVISSLMPNKVLKIHDDIHTQKVHYLTKQKKFPTYWKIATQVIIAVISVVLLR